VTLQRKTPMSRGTKPLRSDPERQREWQRRSRKRLPAKSERRIDETPERQALVAKVLAERPVCEATLPWCCTRASAEVNELMRGSHVLGGYLDVDRVTALCHNCHAWISVRPTWSYNHGQQVTHQAGADEYAMAAEIRTLTAGRCDVDCQVDHREAFDA
jgi:hypothetical protein